MEVNSLSRFNNLRFGQADQVNSVKTTPPAQVQPTQDSVEVNKPVEPPKIGYFRVLFHRLSNKQIKQVNASGSLPKNAKFVETEGEKYRYKIKCNLFGIRKGTRKIPEGFELKKNFWGFTIVVPKGTTGLFIRNAK